MTKQEFYRSIARHYDEIFPLNPAQVKFVSSRLAQDGTVLDIGCASGELSLALAAKGTSVIGLDLDESLVEIARGKSPHPGLDVQWRVGDMTRLDEEFASERFAGIICVGNTLVHLPSKQAIGGLLKSAKSHLQDGAPLIVQTINYDRVLQNKVTQLPLIDNASVKFERFYTPRDDGALNFDTRLLVKSSELTLDNSVRLLPMRKSSLDELYRAAGFAQVEYFGSFKGDPFEESTSYALVSVAI